MLESDLKIPGQCPPLNVVVQPMGSGGDVQPFVALGMLLNNTVIVYG